MRKLRAWFTDIVASALADHITGRSMRAYLERTHVGATPGWASGALANTVGRHSLTRVTSDPGLRWAGSLAGVTERLARGNFNSAHALVG